MQQTFAGQLLNALSWTLIHSLWQGLLLTLIAGIILSTTKRSSPSLRYSLLTILLFCFIGTVLVTFIWQWQMNTGDPATQLLNASALEAGNIPPRHNWWNNFTQFMHQYSGWIVPAWGLIVLLKIARMLVDFYYVNRLRTSYINQPEENWTIRLQQLAREIGIRKEVVLLESRLVNIPLVAGHFKPVILVPLGILTRLSSAEIEAVLLHELAHIRRHDYLINLVQRVTSIAFFFNPGILWLSSLLSAERENCCDDVAITHTNNKLQFVEALLSVKQHSLSSPSIAMNFLGQKNLLLHRVNRIVYNRNKALNIAEMLFLVFSLVCTILLFNNAKRTAPSEAKLLSITGQYTQPVMSLSGFADEKPSHRELIPAIPHRERIKNSLDEQRQPGKSIEKSETKLKEPVIPHYVTAPIEPELKKTLPVLSEHEKDLAMAEHDRLQAEKDKAAAELDRKQAEKDRAQAEQDRKQAALDRIQAEKDRAQAELDRKQAEKDREQAIRDARYSS